ncbi:MAG TPA: hypothetical protein VK249_10305 [Anaerolineales bacterium]|nr:hypothetical protein [Anaerolineales bacterium]
MSHTVSGVILILLGLLTVLGAALNWWIIMRPSRLFNRLLGEKVARPIYIAVGFLLMVLGIVRLIGISWLKG